MSVQHMTIGIIGLGDLGGRLALQVSAAGYKALSFDISARTVPEGAIDRQLDISSLFHRPEEAAAAEEVVQRSEFIHWCAPLEALAGFPSLPEKKHLILHSSVMHESIAAKKLLQKKAKFKGEVHVVHCLMNNHNRVVVADDFGTDDLIYNHFRKIGLAPLHMAALEHDQVMSRSQGVFALLIKSGLGEQLDELEGKGLLTPSAQELRKAIKHRESRWTKTTIEAILSNPRLKDFIRELSAHLT